MFNSENKTHYKMYKAGKRWLFGAITVTTFTAGVVGGTLLSNGKSVHADTAVSTTQSQNITNKTSDNMADNAQDSNVQTNETKAVQADSQSSENTKATSNNDQKAATTQADAGQDQSKNVVTTPAQNNDASQAKSSADNTAQTTDAQSKADNAPAAQTTSDSNKQDDDTKTIDQNKVTDNTSAQTKPQSDATSTQKTDSDAVVQNKATDTKQTDADTASTTKKTDENSVAQNSTDQNKSDNQAAPENDSQKATEDANQSHTQAAETNLAATDNDALKVTFSDPDYNKLGLPWVDPDADHFTYGYDTIGTHGAQNPDGSYQPLGPSPVKVRYIIWSTNRNGDGTVYYNEIDENGNLIDTITLKDDGQSADSQYIQGLTYYIGRAIDSNINSKSSGFSFGYNNSTSNPDNIAFTRNWAYDTENGVPGVQYGGENNFIPQTVKQTITWVNKDTKEVMSTHTYNAIAGQHYSVTGIPPEIPSNYYTSLVPTNASGTVSNFGIPGTKWLSDRGYKGYTIYTETDDHGGMDVQTFDGNGNIIKSNGFDPSADDGKGAVIPNGGSDTVHIDASYQYDPTNEQYSWNVPGGIITLLPIYVPQSRNIVFEVAPLGKLIPVDKNGTPIDNGSHDEPYNIDPNDPTKAQQPTIPDIPGYVPIDPNDPSKVLTPGDLSPVDVNQDPGKDTTIPYVVDKQTATITYIDQNGNKVLHTDDLSGKIGEHEDYSTKDELAALEKDGYALVSSDVPDNGITLDYNSGKPLSYTVVVKQVSEPVSEKGTGSLTIHYQYADGQPVLKDANGNAVTDVTKQVTFHRDGTKNGNDITWGDWIPDDGQDVNVSANSPVVTGYYADQKTASGQVTEGNNQTKLVIYNKLGNLIPEVPGGTPVPYPNVPDDPTKAGEPITPNYPGYTPLDPNGNPIKPGTPYPINPNDPGKDTPVPYVADDEKAQVQYVDQDNNDSVIKSDTLDGKFGTKSTYTTKDEIAALEAQGYELVTDGYPGDYTFTTDDPTFTVVLKHKHKTVNPDDPGKPGQPVDPNNPDGPKYPDGTGEQDLVKNITRTIHYQYADGTEASKDVTEQVKYTREITFDEVTGKIIETGKWTSTDPDYAAVDSPAIAGFTPDQAVVGQAATTADDSDSNVTVTYNADAEQAHVNYVDQDNNDSVIKSDTLDGKFGTKSTYTTKDEIAALEAQGYELVTDGYPGDYTFTTDDPTFTVVLKHKHKTVNPDDPGKPGQPVDPNNLDGPKYPDGTGEQDLVKNITRTIHYQYADGTEASKDVTEQVKYTREITFDEVTGKIIETGKWTSTDPDYATVDSPAIAGFTPDQAVVGQAATTADDSDSNVTVTYNADAEQAHVNYVDQDNNDSVIKSDTLDGKFGTKSTYTTKDEIAALEAQGYELVTDGYPGNYTFTTDDPTFTVVLKHKHKTVNPDDPGKPGQPVDPNNPDGPKYPDGTGEQDLVKNITRTIHYQYADGTEASKDVTEQVKYTREITFDEVTGKIIETGKWTSTDPDYAAVDSPAIAGFTPDQAVVGQAATTADDSNSNVTVTYNANAEQAHVNYVDQDNNDSVIKSDTLDGKFGTKSTYTTKDEIAALEAQGYELVTDGYPGDYTFTTDDPTFTVVLKHKHKTVNPDDPGKPGQPVDPNNPDGPKYPDGTGEQDLVKNITRTIHYQYADGTEASKDVTEQVKYTREITFDEVTGKIIETGKWTSTDPNYAAVDSPAIAGFTPDQAVVGQAATTADDSDSNVTVTYNADAEQAHVNYVDQDNNDSVIKSDTLDGKFGTKSTYTTKDEIAALEAQGYELVTDGYPGDYTFTTDDPIFTVVLKHKHKTVNPDDPGKPGQPVDPNNPDGPKYPDGTGEQDLVKNITRTIHYQYADGTEASKDVTEQVKYTREITFDEVTGKIIETGKWTSTDPDYAAVDSPAIAGFTPDQAVVGQAATTADDSDSNVTVIYNANAEQAHVNYVDQDNNDSVIKSDTLDGKFGQKSTYTTKDEIAALEAQGYELVTDGYPGDYTFTTDDPTFTVVLKHKTSSVTPDNPGTPGQQVDPNNPDGPKYPDGTGEKDLVKDITRTIHYKDDQGNTVAKDVVESTKFGRDATFDEVTGKIISYGDWTPINDTFGAVNSPVINGYYTDTPEVSAETVKADATDSEVTVLYHALGHLVPDVPGSNPVIYPNNPTNPSEAGNPLIPDIPGYTPVDKNGNKLTPGTPYPIDHDHLGEDTPIHYVKNEEPATPVTPSTPATPAQPAEPSAPVTPAAKPAAPVQPAAPAPQAPAKAETPAAKPAEAPKKAALPQTGQDATTSLMSIIGAILLSILGFFGLDGFRKKREDK